MPIPGSIFGARFQNAVADARGKGPGWGGMIPGPGPQPMPGRTPNVFDRISQMGPQFGPPSMVGQQGMTPGMPNPSVKFGSATGPVNPGPVAPKMFGNDVQPPNSQGPYPQLMQALMSRFGGRFGM